MPAVEHAVLPPAYEMRDGKLVPYVKANAVERRLAELRASTAMPAPAPAPAPPPRTAPERSAGEELARAALGHVDSTDDDDVKRSVENLFPG